MKNEHYIGMFRSLSMAWKAMNQKGKYTPKSYVPFLLRYVFRYCFKRKRMIISSSIAVHMWLDEEMREWTRSGDPNEVIDMVGCLTHLKRLGGSLTDITANSYTPNAAVYVIRGRKTLTKDEIEAWQVSQIYRYRLPLTVSSMQRTDNWVRTHWVRPIKQLH